MFPTNSERLIGISDDFSAFVYGYPSSCPRARCTPNKSAPTLSFVLFLLNVLRCQKHIRDKYSAGMDLDIQAMPVGTYRVQSPGFPKIVYYENGEQVGKAGKNYKNDEEVR